MKWQFSGRFYLAATVHFVARERQWQSSENVNFGLSNARAKTYFLYRLQKKIYVSGTNRFVRPYYNTFLDFYLGITQATTETIFKNVENFIFRH
jgi:hypothetical protein